MNRVSRLAALLVVAFVLFVTTVAFAAEQVFNVGGWQVKVDFGHLFLAVSTFIGIIWGAIEKNKDLVARIVLRIEKDAADGWTNEEKEAFAVDMYFNELLPSLPAQYWLLRMIPRFIMEPVLRKAVKALCARARIMPAPIALKAGPLK